MALCTDPRMLIHDGIREHGERIQRSHEFLSVHIYIYTRIYTYRIVSECACIYRITPWYYPLGDSARRRRWEDREKGRKKKKKRKEAKETGREGRRQGEEEEEG